jgi:hypothetical protein
VLCDENGIGGGDGEFYGDNAAQLYRIDVFTTRLRAASAYRGVLRLRARRDRRCARVAVNHTRGINWAKDH